MHAGRFAVILTLSACVGIVGGNSAPPLATGVWGAAPVAAQLASSQLGFPTVTAVDAQDNVYVAVLGPCGLSNTIVKLSPQGVVLGRFALSFGSGAGQVKIITGLAADASGNMYLADYLNNRVQKLSPEGEPLASWSGGPRNAGFSHPQGLALDAQGNVYVVDSQGTRVLKLSPSGDPVASYGVGSSAQFEGLNSPEDDPESLARVPHLIGFLLNGVAVDGAGNIYVATGFELRKLSPSGVPLATWRTPSPQSGERIGATQVAVDSQGNIYLTGQSILTGTGGIEVEGFNSVQKLSPSGALAAQWGRSGVGAGQLSEPLGIAADGQGDLFVADADNNRVQKFSSQGDVLAIWGNTRITAPGAGRFDFPNQIGVSPRGTIYVSAVPRYRILQVSPSGKTVATWNGKRDGRQLFVPAGLAVDRKGNVYAGDLKTDSVLELSPRGQLLARWALPRHKDPIIGTIAVQAQYLTVDSRGTVYVADSDGSLYVLSRSSKRWRELVHGEHSNLTHDMIGSLAVDRRGRIYTADLNRVEIFGPTGKRLGRRAAGETCALLHFLPAAVAVDSRDDLYVADATPVDRIVEFSPSGRVLHRWGSRGDGPNQFEFDVEAGLAVDSHGDVYVTDTSSRVRKFSPNGKLLAHWH